MNEGESITVCGSTTPDIPEAMIDLIYEGPEGMELNRSVVTDSNGAYSDQVVPEETGVWKVRALWRGDETMERAISSEAFFTVIRAFRVPSETLVTSILIVLALIGFYFSKLIRLQISKIRSKF